MAGLAAASIALSTLLFATAEGEGYTTAPLRGGAAESDFTDLGLALVVTSNIPTQEVQETVRYQEFKDMFKAYALQLPGAQCFLRELQQAFCPLRAPSPDELAPCMWALYTAQNPLKITGGAKVRRRYKSWWDMLIQKRSFQLLLGIGALIYLILSMLSTVSDFTSSTVGYKMESCNRDGACRSRTMLAIGNEIPDMQEIFKQFEASASSELALPSIAEEVGHALTSVHADTQISPQLPPKPRLRSRHYHQRADWRPH